MNSTVLRCWRVPQETLVLCGIVVIAAFFSPTTSSGENIFLTGANLSDALRAITPVALMALAMTLVILAGGIDLSVGSVLALAGTVAARVLTEWTSVPGLVVPVAAAVLAALLAGGLIGVANGGLVATLGIQPFIITLASMIGVRGLALWLANNERIGLGVGTGAAGGFGPLFSSKPIMIGTLVTLGIAFVILLNRTVFGRYVRAIGDNPVAAYHAGLPIRRVQVTVYGLSGFMAAVAGLLLTARTTTGDPTAGVALELDTIAAVVIGGTRLSGGKGRMGGTIHGALIMGIVTNILGLRNVDSNLQMVLKALIILLAVFLQTRQPRP